MPAGLILKRPKLKDYAFEQIYGSAPKNELIVPLNRDISNIPDIYQGPKNDCVACTFTFIKQHMEETHPDLSHEFLAAAGKTKPEGATPEQIADAARKFGVASQAVWDEKQSVLLEEVLADAKNHKIGSYSYVQDLSMHGIYNALKKGLVAIGVRNFNGIGPHMMAAYDVTPDGLALLCKDSNNPKNPAVVSFADVVVAISCHEKVDKSVARLPFLQGLWKVVTWKKWQAILGAILTAITGVYGAYTPVTSYEARTTSYIDAAASTIPVSTVVDRAGNAIDMANMPSGRAYFNLEPGLPSKEELVYCTGISGSSWTGCVRGLSFQGGGLAASSTLAETHNAGSKVIMTNIGQFFTEFVAATGTNRIGGQVYFAFPPKLTATTTLPTLNDQLVNKYYVDSVGAGGFTSANASTTQGILVNGTSPETIGINLLDTLRNSCHFYGGGLFFDPANGCALSLNVSSTQFSIGSDGLLAINSTGLTFSNIASSTVSGFSPVNMNALSAFFATGTAGMPLSSGQAIYLSTTGTLFLASANQTTTTYRYVGITQSAANVGQTVIYARPGGIASGLSGFTPGNKYFLGVTPGGVTSTSPGHVPAMLGTAMSASTLLLEKPNYTAVWAGIDTRIIDGANEFVMGFIPNHVDIWMQSSVNDNRSPTSTWDYVLGNGGNFLGHVTSTFAGFTSSTANGACKTATYTTTSRGIIWNFPCVNTGVPIRVLGTYNLDGIPLH